MGKPERVKMENMAKCFELQIFMAVHAEQTTESDGPLRQRS